MDNKNIAIIALSVVVLLLAIGLFGILFQTNAVKPNKTAKIETIIKSLSSKVVPSVVAFGEVSKIDGRNITLTYGGDSITINIANDAKIYSFVDVANGQAQSGSQQIMASFGDIKNGDKLSINLKVLPDDGFEGQSVIIVGLASDNSR